MASTSPETGHAPVNGVEMHYEIYGGGEPLVLLHGGVAASEVFDPVLPALAGHRRMVSVHLQAHGRTRDVDRPLRCESMADDVAALIGHLGLGRADLLGYSMGGGAAGGDSPPGGRREAGGRLGADEAGRLVPRGAGPVRRDGRCRRPDRRPDEALAAGRALPRGRVGGLFAKVGEMASLPDDWSAEVAAITAPTMLVFADADAIRPAHVVEFWERLGGGQRDAGLDGALRPAARLAVLPGATHHDLVSHPALAGLVASFLDAPVPGAE